MEGMTLIQKLSSVVPCDVVFVPTNRGVSPLQREDSVMELVTCEYSDCGFRGVPLASLPAVLQNGVDVYPTTSVIFVAELDKALEYGNVILALRWDSLRPTFKHITVENPQEVETARAGFPTVIELDDHSLWCTRLEQNDPRIATDYEIAYARWIPGNAWDALKAVVLVGGPEDRLVLEGLLSQGHGNFNKSASRQG